MENMAIYESCRVVPEEAKKPINGGRLKGMTDINPMWRIKELTHLFGTVGFGWYFKTINKWVEDREGETCAFVDIELYVKVDGEWSAPICGTGGSKLVMRDKNGSYVNDECFKMATTDALSVACKQLGMGADVYWNKDAASTKYQVEADMQAKPIYEEEKKKPTKKQEPVKEPEPQRNAKDDIPGYPTRDKLLEIARKHYPDGTDPQKNLLANWKISRLEDASTAQLSVIYKRYGDK